MKKGEIIKIQEEFVEVNTEEEIFNGPLISFLNSSLPKKGEIGFIDFRKGGRTIRRRYICRNWKPEEKRILDLEVLRRDSKFLNADEYDFEKEFPGLKGKESYVNSWELDDKEKVHPSHRIKVFEIEDIQENCIDKQRAREILDKERTTNYIPKWIKKMLKKELGL